MIKSYFIVLKKHKEKVKKYFRKLHFMNNLFFYLILNITITSLASLIFIFFMIKTLLIKEKEAPHWVFLAICFFSLFRITNFYLIIIPVLKENESIGILLYRIQTATFFFLPSLIAHMFYSLLYKNDKKKLLIILFLYVISLCFYISALIGFYPTARELKIVNNTIYFINNTTSYIYKSVIIFFVFSYIFSIYLIFNFSRIKMTAKDRKIINIIQWVYIITFGYGYIIQFFISLMSPAFFPLAPYLLIFLSIVIYTISKYYNFLKIYNTQQFFNLVNENFTVTFIITDEKGMIIKSNLNTIDNINYYGKSIYSIFNNSEVVIKTILEDGKIVKNLNLISFNHVNQIEISFTVDINPIRDKFQDILGLFLVLTDCRISLSSFSKREQDIINYLTQGLSYKEIAYELNISYNTVNSHVKNIYKKANVNDRNELLDSINHIK
ncbi:MAG: hypothetical protein A2355_16850 [Spirochaetes bacterium RIFOXYB1_FULL_32_8]|nr:MAG: hypothetical protein A2355_16850 [Spirochaetes bacterium RIFOXYB1_FULL_32_8]